MRTPAAVLITVLIAGCGAGSGEGQGAADASAVRPAAQPAVPPLDRWPLRVDPGGFRLGMVAPSTNHDAVVTLINQGDQPLRITETSTSCRCTAPQQLAGTVIPPGGSVPFTATYKAGVAPGFNEATVFVKFESGGTHQHASIPIEADVVMDVRAIPSYVEALNGVTSGTLRVESLDGRPFRILSTFGHDPIYADDFDPGLHEPRSDYALQWYVDFPTEEDCDKARLWWIVETDHPDCPILPVTIRHDCTGFRRDAGHLDRRWIFVEYLANLGAVTAGETVEVDVGLLKFRKRKTVQITSVESLDPNATAELIETIDTPGKFATCRVRFTPKAGYEGLLYAMVFFDSDVGGKDIAFVAKVEN